MTWGKVILRAAPLLLIIVLTSYFTGGGWSAIPSALVAWGTILLAYVAYMSILENRRIRTQEREHDFKRRCLKDIQDWAEKGISFLMELGVPDIETRKSLTLLAPLRAMNKWMMDASRIFAEDDKKALLKKVDEAAENLKQYCKVLERELSSEGIDWRHDHCITLFTEVLERIADLKVKLKM